MAGSPLLMDTQNALSLEEQHGLHQYTLQAKGKNEQYAQMTNLEDGI